MKLGISRRYKLHKLAPARAGRFAFDFVQLSKGHAWVTDGRAMARVDVATDAPTRARVAYVHRSAFQVVAKGRGVAKLELTAGQLRAPEIRGRPAWEAGGADDVEFPDCARVLAETGNAVRNAEEDGEDVHITLNPRLLLSLAEAMGSPERIALHGKIVKTNEGARVVNDGMIARGVGATGVIMPIRDDTLRTPR